MYSQVCISNLNLASEIQIHVFYSLLDISTWMSNTHLNLSTSQRKHLIFPKHLLISQTPISVTGNSLCAVQPLNQSSTRSLSLTPHNDPLAIQDDPTATTTTLIKATICILLITLPLRYFQCWSQSTPVKHEVDLLFKNTITFLISHKIKAKVLPKTFIT